MSRPIRNISNDSSTVLANGNEYSRPPMRKLRSPGSRPMPSLRSQG